MSARLALIETPFAPAPRFAEVPPGLSVADAISHAGWSLRPSTVLLKAGIAFDAIDWTKADPRELLVRRADWDATAVNDNEIAVLITLPQGGGGSNPLAILAQVALVALSIWAPGAGLLVDTLNIGLSTAKAIVSAAILIGGKLLLSAVLPQPGSKSPASASPAYSLGAQSNQARLGGAIPEQFGEFNIFPDLAMQPYFSYSDNNQQLFQLFVLGRGQYDVSKLLIGSNPFADTSAGPLASTDAYPEIEWEIVPPNGTVSLFTDDNVATSTEINEVELLGTDQDGYDWTAWVVSNPPKTTTNHIAFDLSCPAGLYTTSSSGKLKNATVTFTVQGQQIDDSGAPAGDVFTIFDNLSLSRATNEPQRFTYDWAGDAGRYRVRAERTNKTGGSTSTVDELVWVALRAFLPPILTYGDVTLLALKMTATKNINSTSADQVNAVQTRMLPAYDPVTKTWSDPAATRSIAWAAAYVARQKYADGAIDLDWLAQYDNEVWSTRGDSFDGVFDGSAGGSTWWAALQAILKPGRSQPFLAAGVLSFSRDEPKSVPVCGFSPRNMAAASFNTVYRAFGPDDVDGLLVQYVDRRDWKQHEVLCKMADSNATADTATPYQAFGINNYGQAWREGIFTDAVNRLRRTFPSWDTELPGRVCFRGDPVKLAHWSANFGASADALSLIEDDAGDMLVLSEPWELSADADDSPMINLLAPDGQICGPIPVAIVDDGSSSKRAQVRLLDDDEGHAVTPAAGKYAGHLPRSWAIWGFDDDDGDGLQMERPRVQMGAGANVPRDALIVSMTPGAAGKTTIAAVIENQAVHLADLGAPPPEADPPQNSAVTDLFITGLEIDDALTGASGGNDVLVDVTADGAADAASFDYRTRVANSDAWSAPVTGNDREFSFHAIAGAVFLQVRAVDGADTGNWFERDFTAGDGADTPAFDFSNPANSGSYAVLSSMWS